MNCNKCGSILTDGECPLCFDEFKRISQLEPVFNPNKNMENIMLILSIISVIISIFPINIIFITIGFILAIIAGVVSIKLRLKHKSIKVDVTILFTIVSVLSLMVWLYFLTFIVDKL